MNPTTYAHLKKVRRDALHAAFQGASAMYSSGRWPPDRSSDGNLVGPAYTMRNIPARGTF